MACRVRSQSPSNLLKSEKCRDIPPPVASHLVPLLRATVRLALEYEGIKTIHPKYKRHSFLIQKLTKKALSSCLGGRVECSISGMERRGYVNEYKCDIHHIPNTPHGKALCELHQQNNNNLITITTNEYTRPTNTPHSPAGNYF